MAKNGKPSSATAPATTPTEEPATTYTVTVCFDLDASPVVSVAPPQVAVRPEDTITFILESPNDTEATFYFDPKAPALPLVAWGGGGDWDSHQSQLKSVTWAVTWGESESHTSFSMTSPQVGSAYEYAGAFTYTVAVQSGGQVYYAGDPTIVNEPPPVPTPLKGA